MEILNRENIFHALKEIVWLLLTAMATFVVLYPITQKIDYTYYGINAVFIFVTLTYFRWSVTLSSLPFFRPRWTRFLAFAINVSLFVYLMSQEQKFLMYIDNFYTEDFGFPRVFMFDDVKQNLFRYLYSEIILFGTGSLVMITAFNMRLLISWWQFYKYRASSLLED